MSYKVLMTFIFITSTLSCNQTSSNDSKVHNFQLVSATIIGLNQYRTLPSIKITDGDQLKTFIAFFEDIGMKPPKDSYHVDYNEKYKVIFAMPNGVEVIVNTLYHDGAWHREGELDQTLRPGLSEFLEPIFEKERKHKT